MPEEIKGVEIDPEIYDDYVGEYDLQIGSTITIVREGKKLYAKVEGQDAFEILPSSEMEFFYKLLDANIGFGKNESGEVTKLTLKQAGQEFESSKIK